VRRESRNGTINQLKVNRQHEIIVLADGGLSGRNIGKLLGIDGGTVAKYLAAEAPALATVGSTGDPISNPSISTAGR
jgi:hypothetical protein